MASKKVIAAKIAGLAMIYRPNMSPAECQVLCQEYDESLRDLNDEQFLRGVIEAKKVCRFMPTPADIRQGYENLPAPRQNQLALPAIDFSSSSWAQQQAMSMILHRFVDDDPKAKEFLELRISVDSPEWGEKAREVLGADYPESENNNRHRGHGLKPLSFQTSRAQ